MAILKTTSIMLGMGVAFALGGCSSGGGGMFGLGDSSSPITTSALPAAPKVDPACGGLTSQIATLRQDGIAEKIEKAAAKKYKMTAADLTKADQLTKASAEYQTKCGTGPKPTVAQAPVTTGTTNIGSAAPVVTPAAAGAAVKTAVTAAPAAAAAAPAAAKAVAAAQ